MFDNFCWSRKKRKIYIFCCHNGTIEVQRKWSTVKSKNSCHEVIYSWRHRKIISIRWTCVSMSASSTTHRHNFIESISLDAFNWVSTFGEIYLHKNRTSRSHRDWSDIWDKSIKLSRWNEVKCARNDRENYTKIARKW